MSLAKPIGKCKSCNCSKPIELNAEISLTFPGLNGLKTMPIFVYRRISMCSDCGSILFELFADELRRVKDGALQAEGT